jgi:hypothetical protein
MKYLEAGPSAAGWSRLSKVLKCPRLYALDRGPRDSTSDALIRGDLMHVALAHHYANLRCAQRGDADEYMSAEDAVAHCVANQPSDALCSAYDRWAHKVISVYHQYCSKYIVPSWTIRDVENVISTKFADPEMDREYAFSSRLDLEVEHQGKVYYVDHKTSFAILPKTYNKYTLSGQFLGQQIMGQERHGERFGGIILNLIGWDDRKPVSSFKRKVLPYAEKSVAMFPETVILAERVIARYKGREAMDWPGAHVSTACHTTYGPCPFFNQCRMGG